MPPRSASSDVRLAPPPAPRTADAVPAGAIEGADPFERHVASLAERLMDPVRAALAAPLDRAAVEAWVALARGVVDTGRSGGAPAVTPADAALLATQLRSLLPECPALGPATVVAESRALSAQLARRVLGRWTAELAAVLDGRADDAGAVPLAAGLVPRGVALSRMLSRVDVDAWGLPFAFLLKALRDQVDAWFDAAGGRPVVLAARLAAVRRGTDPSLPFLLGHDDRSALGDGLPVASEAPVDAARWRGRYRRVIEAVRGVLDGDGDDGGPFDRAEARPPRTRDPDAAVASAVVAAGVALGRRSAATRLAGRSRWALILQDPVPLPLLESVALGIDTFTANASGLGGETLWQVARPATLRDRLLEYAAARDVPPGLASRCFAVQVIAALEGGLVRQAPPPEADDRRDAAAAADGEQDALDAALHSAGVPADRRAWLREDALRGAAFWNAAP